MGSNKPIVSLFIVQFFAIFSLSIYGTYVGIHLDRLSASAFIIGTVFAIRNFIQIFLRVPLSEISQIVGRKPLIVLGILFYNIAMASLYFATDWKLVFVSSILIGIAMSLHWPAVFSYIGDIAGDEYGRFSGIIFQGQDIGIILSALAATYLLSGGIITLTGLFGITFIFGMVGMIISIFILPEVLEEEHRKHTDSILRALFNSFWNMTKSLKKLSKQFPLGMVYLIELLVTFTEFFFMSFFPLLVVLTLGS